MAYSGGKGGSYGGNAYASTPAPGTVQGAYGNNAFTNSSQGFQDAFNAIQNGFMANNYMLAQPPNTYQAAGMGGYGSYNPAMMGGWASYDPSMQADPATIRSQMSRYTNPYENEVVKRTASGMRRDRNMALEQNAADAIASGAFGGSRHGLVEANTIADSNRNIGDVTAQLRHQGFTTAGDLASRDVANQIGVASANQGAANLARQFGAANQQGMLSANQNALNTAASFGGTNYQRMLEHDASAENQARQFNAIQGGDRYNDYFNNLMQGVDRLGNLSQASYGVGSDINQRQQQSGDLIRSIQEAIFGSGQQMFQNYVSQPEQLLQLRLASLGMNPLNNAGTTTATTSQGTGFGDILGALLQTGGNMFQMNPITFGGN